MAKKTKRLKTQHEADVAVAFHLLMPTKEEQNQFWTTWGMETWLTQWNTLLGLASATDGLKTRHAVIDAFSKLQNTAIQLHNLGDELALQSSVRKQIVTLTDEMTDVVNQYIDNPSTKTLSQIWIVANNKTDKLAHLFTKVYAQWD